MKISIIHVSIDAPASCRLIPLFILDKHIHPYGISNPEKHCYIKSVIQLLISNVRTISHDLQLNSSTEGCLSKFLFETAHSASSSADVDAFKFRLVRYDSLFGGQIQQGSSGYLMMLIEAINKGIINCGSNNNISTGVLCPHPYFHLFGIIYCVRCRWSEIPLIWL